MLLEGRALGTAGCAAGVEKHQCQPKEVLTVCRALRGDLGLEKPQCQPEKVLTVYRALRGDMCELQDTHKNHFSGRGCGSEAVPTSSTDS